MRVVRSLGKCISCGNMTNVKLDCGKYACASCLARIGRETNNVRKYLDIMAEDIDMQQFMGRFLEVLCLMKDNNITTIDNIVKTLTAIQYYKEYKDGTINKENKEKIQKQLDIFYFL